jgi:hypothetical protein
MKFFDPVLDLNFFGHLIAGSAHVTIRQASPREVEAWQQYVAQTGSDPGLPWHVFLA